MTDIVRARLENTKTTVALVNRWLGHLIDAADPEGGDCAHPLTGPIYPEDCSRCVARRELAAIRGRIHVDGRFVRRDDVLTIVDTHIERFLGLWGTSKRGELMDMRDAIAKKGS